jgi:hypothetical protein
MTRRTDDLSLSCESCVSLFILFVFFVSWWFNSPVAAGDTAKPKPEWRATRPLAVPRGKTPIVKITGQDLAPTAIKFDDARVTAKILKCETLSPKTDEEKAGGNRSVEVELTFPDGLPPGIYQFKLIHEGSETPVGQIYIDEPLPEIEEKEPSDDLRKAHVLPAGSVAILGKLDKSGAAVFQVDGKAGETWRFEVVAHRVGSPLEPILRLRDVRLTPLRVAVDEGEDCAIDFQLPADGPYLIELFDANNQSKADFLYRLRVIRNLR